MNTTTPRQPLPDEVWEWIEQHAPYDSADLMQRWMSGRPITDGQQRAIDEAASYNLMGVIAQQTRMMEKKQTPSDELRQLLLRATDIYIERIPANEAPADTLLAAKVGRDPIPSLGEFENAMMSTFKCITPEVRLTETIPLMVRLTIEDMVRERPDLRPFLIADDLCRDIKAVGEKLSNEMAFKELPSAKRKGQSTTALIAELREMRNLKAEIEAALASGEPTAHNQIELDAVGNIIEEIKTALAARGQLEAAEAVQ